MVEIATGRDHTFYDIRGYVYGTGINPILEDPNPAQGRLYINAQAYDISSLAPIHSKKWHYNLQYSYFNQLQSGRSYGTLNSLDDYFDNVNAGHNTFYNGSVYGTAYSETAAGQSNRFPKFNGHFYHLTCDPQNYPIRSYLKLQSNNIMMTYPIAGLHNASGGLTTKLFIYPSDVTQFASVQGPQNFDTYASASGYYYLPNGLMFEDAHREGVWGIKTNGDGISSAYYNYQPVGYNKGYEPGVASTANVASTYYTFNVANYESFWMGNDVYNFPYFFRINKGANNDPVTVSYINTTTRVGTDILTAQQPSSNYTALGQNMFPSNVRTVSSTRKAFYTMHYDSTGALAAMKFDWDPTQLGSVTKTNCAFTYPGSNNFFNYANRPILGTQQTVSTYHAMGVSWSKAYQFTVGSTNYITFTWADHGIMNTSSYYLQRFTSPLQRTWLTFTLGSGTNDYQLTYHSKVTFNQYSDFPRAWLPTTFGGSTLATITATGIKFLTFNTTTGWQQSGIYNAGGPCIYMGLDSTNRLWGVFGDKACGSVHTITPSAPVTLSLVMASNSYTYTGTNITTSAILNAYDSGGSRYSANVSLTIDGTTMTFDDASKSKSFQTSASADTTVNLIISGGGINNITTSINV